MFGRARTSLTRLVSAALAGAVALTCAQAPSLSFAAEGTLSLASQAGPGSQESYRAYRLFRADVAADGTARNLSWEDDVAKGLVLAVLDDAGNGAQTPYAAWLKEHGHTLATSHDLALNAADYVAAMIAASSDDPGSFARVLAARVSATLTPVGSVSASQTLSGEQGYYLLLTDTGTIAEGSAASLPLWVPVSSASTVSPKVAVPTLSKGVRERAEEEYGLVADARAGQELLYRVEVQVPAGAAAYGGAYELTLTDTLPAGLTLAGDGTSAVELWESGAPAPYAQTALAVSGNVITAQLDQAAPGSVVELRYRARLTDAAVPGSAGNVNVAQLSYSADPSGDARGSTEARARALTYVLTLEKRDESSGKPLPGGAFVIKTPDGDYVQGDGSLGKDPYEFVYDDQGKARVPFLDEGSYVVHETRPPEGYEPSPDMTIVVRATKNQATGELDDLTVEVEGGTGTADRESGAIDVVSLTRRAGTMPNTGRTSRPLVLVGAVLVALGLCAIVALRRRDRKQG